MNTQSSVDSFDPQHYPYIPGKPNMLERKEALGEKIAELAAHINVATYRLLLLIAEFDRQEAWAELGAKSCAHWLNWRVGYDIVTARQKVRVARALEELPVISKAFSEGSLSYSKVRALCRIATAENEKELVIMAKDATANHLEKFVRGYRKAYPEQEIACANEQFRDRYLRYHYDDDGSLIINAKLPAEQGAKLLKALEMAEDMNYAQQKESQESVRNTDDSAESPLEQKPGYSQRQADALGTIADTMLEYGLEAGKNSDSYQVIVHVDGETLANPCCDGRSKLEHGPKLAVETVRRLSCDGSKVIMQHDAKGNVLDVGRKTRIIPPAIRRALRHRDQSCQFVGCTHDKFLRAHHIDHWAEGGATKLDNLVHLCDFHHRLVHEGGYKIAQDSWGKLVFHRPDGRIINTHPQSPKLPANPLLNLIAVHYRAGFDIRADSIPTWSGYPVDYDMAIECIAPKNIKQ